jgi:hypothetical protein
MLLCRQHCPCQQLRAWFPSPIRWTAGTLTQRANRLISLLCEPVALSVLSVAVQANAIRLPLHLNLAACDIQNQEWRAALANCDEVGLFVCVFQAA